MAAMGRKPTTNLNLPTRMRARVKARGVTWFYYDTGGKPRREIPLGNESMSMTEHYVRSRLGQKVTPTR